MKNGEAKRIVAKCSSKMKGREEKRSLHVHEEKDEEDTFTKSSRLQSVCLPLWTMQLPFLGRNCIPYSLVLANPPDILAKVIFPCDSRFHLSTHAI